MTPGAGRSPHCRVIAPASPRRFQSSSASDAMWAVVGGRERIVRMVAGRSTGGWLKTATNQRRTPRTHAKSAYFTEEPAGTTVHPSRERPAAGLSRTNRVSGDPDKHEDLRTAQIAHSRIAPRGPFFRMRTTETGGPGSRGGSLGR